MNKKRNPKAPKHKWGMRTSWKRIRRQKRLNRLKIEKGETK